MAKVLPFDRVQWFHSGRKHTRGHAFQHDSFVSVCGAVVRDDEAWTPSDPEGWTLYGPVGLRCRTCVTALTRPKLVRT
jgi:hypothetical protein